MVSMKGLSSTKATTATGKVSIVCSVLLMAISAYMWFVEALLDQAGWLEARIPGLNSFSYGSGVYLATMVQLFTALYSLGSSAVRRGETNNTGQTRRFNRTHPTISTSPRHTVTFRGLTGSLCQPRTCPTVEGCC